MATEPPKATPTTPEHPPFAAAPPPVPYPHFNSTHYVPPPGTYPGFYPYPAPPDAANGESGTPGAPPGYMMFSHPPPGMMFTFTPPQNPGHLISPSSDIYLTSLLGFTAPQAPATPSALTRPKRKQVKMAVSSFDSITRSNVVLIHFREQCTNCAAACKRCDENRPCERCRKYGITDTCIDGQRKERKKGIKRGPYKRKNKSGDDATPQFTGIDGGIISPLGHVLNTQLAENSPEGEWAAGPASSSTTPATTVAAIQAVAHQFSNGEAFYHPIYYPPPAPGTFLAPPPPLDGADGSAAHSAGQPVPYYIGAYPPPFHYPPFMHGALPPPQPPPQTAAPAQTTVDPAATSGNGEGAVVGVGENGTVNGKKRTRKNGTEPKSKKAKRRGKSPKEVVGATAAALDVAALAEGEPGLEPHAEAE